MAKQYTEGKAERPVVFAARDYRVLLRQFYEWRKQNGRYSFRTFSQAAGLNSPNYLKLVIDGERNLSLDLAPRFAEAFGFNREEADFFQLLVRYGNAGDTYERSQLFHLIENHRKAEGVVENLNAYEAFFGHWAYPVLNLMLAFPDIDQDPKKLARMLVPSLPANEVRKALEVLQTLGYVEKRGERLVPTQKVIETPLEISQVWMRQYHTRVLERAIASLDEVPQDERNVSTFAVALPQSQIPEFLEHVHRLRRELFRYARSLSETAEGPDDAVYQLAIQAFPVAKRDDEGA